MVISPSTIVGLVLALFVAACRFCRHIADFYSLHLYPVISGVLSFVTSALPFSFNDLAIVCLIVAALAILLSSIIRRKRWTECLARELKLALWVFVWFYIGWCANYYRSDILARTGTSASRYDEQEFKQFLDRYTTALNDAYVTFPEPVEVERDIKEFYNGVPGRYGLCRPKPWQHSKPMLIGPIQSAVGVTGYMGPLGSEFHINRDVLAENYPFTYAHEYSHLMGVSSEAEANWWAYRACLSSDDPRIRYSGYYSILPYVWNNARGLLSDEDFRKWRGEVRPEVVDSLMAENQYWNEKRIPVLDKVQSLFYDLFLKANKVGSGMKNYSEVVMLIISLDSRM